jgi:hypothetical protein
MGRSCRDNNLKESPSRLSWIVDESVRTSSEGRLAMAGLAKSGILDVKDPEEWEE